jgi:hypothetical protein
MPEKLSQFEMEIVLKFLLYNMSMELRDKFMNMFPTIYNRLYGREVMKVTRVED